MTQKLDISDIKIDAVMEATFWANPVEESKFRFRATHLDGKRAPKVVLTDDTRVTPGVPCLVRIKAVRKPERVQPVVRFAYLTGWRDTFPRLERIMPLRPGE